MTRDEVRMWCERHGMKRLSSGNYVLETKRGKFYYMIRPRVLRKEGVTGSGIRVRLRSAPYSQLKTNDRDMLVWPAGSYR